jgi:hypothetical protein
MLATSIQFAIESINFLETKNFIKLKNRMVVNKEKMLGAVYFFCYNLNNLKIEKRIKL